MSFLHSYIFLALISGVSWGSEITPFALFEPVPYKRESRFYQYAISKVGVGAVGRFYDVDKAVKKELAPYNKDLEKYLETEEVFDKAGAYAIQEGAGQFIKKIEGDYTNIVGLPIAAVKKALKNIGFAL